MVYKLERITHTGRKGIAGTERTDGRYPIRKGSLYDIDFGMLKVGNSFPLKYLKDNQGYEKFGYMVTSIVIEIQKPTDDELVIRTLNSKYHLRKYGNNENET